MTKNQYRGDGGSKGKRKTEHAQRDGDNGFNLREARQEIEFLVSTGLTWKERKELENRKAVEHGGKKQKQQRVPLSIARLQMKNQKARDDKMLKERLMYGQHGGMKSSVSKRIPEKRKREDMVLKSTVGHFRNGVLDVKHMLKSRPSNDAPSDAHASHKGKKGGGKKKKGKKHGGGRNSH